MKGKAFCRRCGWYPDSPAEGPATPGASKWVKWPKRPKWPKWPKFLKRPRHRGWFSRMLYCAAAVGFLAPLLLADSEEGKGFSFAGNRLARLVGLDRALPLSPSARGLRCANSLCGADLALSSTGSQPCPDCGTPSPWLLASETGWIEPAPDLLRGFVPPGAAALARGRHRDQAAVVLWFQTYRRLRELDPSARIRLPETTWRERGGDARDHALFLADLLGSQGYRVRVVLGAFRGRPHSWVVIEYEGREYLLDLLAGRPARFPPRADLLSADYRAELAFDREASYYPVDPPAAPARYFDPALWTRVASPPAR